MVTFEQFLLPHQSNIIAADRKPLLMPSTVQVGTILMKQWPGMPPLMGFEADLSFGEWSMVEAPDAVPLESKIQAAGWNFFYIADEVKAMYFGSLGATKLKNAVHRILAKVKLQNFNGLEVTGVVARHWFGVPYVTVYAHSRHMQESCYLDSPAARRSFQCDAEWARG